MGSCATPSATFTCKFAVARSLFLVEVSSHQGSIKYPVIAWVLALSVLRMQQFCARPANNMVTNRGVVPSLHKRTLSMQYFLSIVSETVQNNVNESRPLLPSSLHDKRANVFIQGRRTILTNRGLSPSLPGKTSTPNDCMPDRPKPW